MKWKIADPVEYAREGCLGSSRYRDDTSMCSRHVMCPKCESRRAAKRTWQLGRRLTQEIEMAEDEGADLKVGVLTTTLPGLKHRTGIRRSSLRKQYNWITERTNFSGRTGSHSMRGLNTLLRDMGVHAGCHNLEFTWNEEKNWWNVHNHSIILADKLSWSDEIRETKDRIWEVGDLLDRTEVTGGTNTQIENLGLGRRYSLDWAEPQEFDQTIRYAAKVAYMTKPIKAPRQKRLELSKFFNGFSGKYPRLSRPYGMWMRSEPLP